MNANNFKRILAVALTVILTAGLPGNTLLAAEGIPVSPDLIGGVQEIQETTVSEVTVPAGESVSDQTPAAETVSAVEAPAAETVSEQKLPEGESAGVSNDAVSADVTPASDVVNEAVIKEITDEINELKAFKAGTDYIEHEAYFVADSKEEAEKVAAEYGAVLDSFEEGVAVIRFESTVEQLLNSVAAKGVVTKAVQPNYIVQAYAKEQVRVPVRTIPMEINPDQIKAGSSVKEVDLNDVFVDKKQFTDLPVSSDYQPEALHTYNDPHYKDGWQWFHEEINTPAVHSEGITGKGIKVAVIDTGVLGSHEEFTGRYKGGYNFIKSNDDPTDDAGHGTHCAGIIGAAANNEKGGLGVAPESEIYAYKVLDSTGRGNTSNILKAVKRATSDGVNVISMSLGGGGYSSDFQKAINDARKKGIVVVAAAGNDYTDTKAYPAAYDNVIAVAAMQDKGSQTLSWFSNYGTWVDVVAPGGGAVNQTYPEDDGSNAATEIFSTYYRTKNGEGNDGYYCMSGTSMACPVVSGLVALVMSSNDKLMTGDEACVDTVTDIIIKNTDGKVYTSQQGHTVKGKVMADAAVEAGKKSDGAKKSGDYRIVDEGGFSRDGHIGIGGSLQLKIYGKDGEVKGAAKKAKWTSSDEQILTVKGGKVKCSSSAKEDSVATIKAVYDNKEMSIDLTVEQKFVKFGINRSRPMIENRSIYFGKIYTSETAYASVGTEYSLTDPSALLTSYGDCGLYYLKSKSGSRKTYGYYNANAYFKYKIMIPAKAVKAGNITVTSTQENGDPSTVVFNKPGTYTIKYKTTDGSRKSFTVKLVVYKLSGTAT